MDGPVRWEMGEGWSLSPTEDDEHMEVYILTDPSGSETPIKIDRAIQPESLKVAFLMEAIREWKARRSRILDANEMFRRDDVQPEPDGA